MKKREFLKIGVLGIAGMTLTPSITKATDSSLNKKLKVPNLLDTYADVEDFISADNLKIHYNKYYLHSAKKLHGLILKKNINPPLKQLFQNSHKIDPVILDSAGEFFNHRLFLKTIKKTENNKLSDNLKQELEKSFGSVKHFEKKFLSQAKGFHNKDGWIWLVKRNEKLIIVKTPGNINPFFSTIASDQQGYPLLGLDMWSHAYENQYSTIDAYCQAYFKALNWSYISKRYTFSL